MLIKKMKCSQRGRQEARKERWLKVRHLSALPPLGLLHLSVGPHSPGSFPNQAYLILPVDLRSFLGTAWTKEGRLFML